MRDLGTTPPVSAGRRHRQRPVLPWRIERKVDPKHIGFYRIGAVLFGLAVSVLLAPFFSGTPPSEFYDYMWTGTLGSPLGTANLLAIAIPLILAGLAASVPFRLRLWNVGIDGQILVGAWAASAIGFALPNTSGALLIPLMMLAAMLGGALWILIPALARVLLGVTEVITTFLLNFVAIAWITYWATGPWTDPFAAGGVRAKVNPPEASLSLVDIDGVLIHWGIYIALILPFVIWGINRFTRWGFETSIVGASTGAGRYSGMSVKRILIASMLVGGALAGLAGAVNMMGTTHQLGPGLTDNTGFNGLVIAVLAGGSPLGVLVLALIYALLIAGGDSVGIVGVPGELVFAVIGLTLIFGALGEAFARLRLVRTHPEETTTSTDRNDNPRIQGHGGNG
ncbi:MAG: ral nucleoside transport system permease protein [Solirubrobacterales bacterium]|jgi:simple sugar transport system permease protein|nr:ral nucleoside transport system permease protein [Solirubrobacterales bacterium]